MFTDIASIFNHRPLIYFSDNSNNLKSHTLNQSLLERHKSGDVIKENDGEISSYRNWKQVFPISNPVFRRWKQVAVIPNQFWKIWLIQYRRYNQDVNGIYFKRKLKQGR